MQMPIDIPKLLEISVDLKDVVNTPLSVSVLIDDTADTELVGHVRAAFASAGVHTRVTIEYISDRPIDINLNDDMAVIIAGESEYVGRQASYIRDAKIPVMIVTNIPKKVEAISVESGYPIPNADIIAPVKLSDQNIIVDVFRQGASRVSKLSSRLLKKDTVEYHTSHIDQMVGDGIQTDQIDGYTDTDEIPLDETTFSYLDARMGEWIMVACSEKKLAFANSFKFVRRPLANDAVAATSLQNAAVGFVPFIPGADLPIMTLNQAKMVLQITTAYGQVLDASRIKEIAAVVAGGLFFRNIARSASKLIPGAGWIISGAIGFTGTEAMGRATIEYFEAGGDIVGIAKVLQSARDEAMEMAKKAASTPTGQKVIDVVKTNAKNIFSKESPAR